MYLLRDLYIVALGYLRKTHFLHHQQKNPMHPDFKLDVRAFGMKPGLLQQLPNSVSKYDLCDNWARAAFLSFMSHSFRWKKTRLYCNDQASLLNEIFICSCLLCCNHHELIITVSLQWHFENKWENKKKLWMMDKLIRAVVITLLCMRFTNCYRQKTASSVNVF